MKKIMLVLGLLVSVNVFALPPAPPAAPPAPTAIAAPPAPATIIVNCSGAPVPTRVPTASTMALPAPPAQTVSAPTLQ